MDFTQFIDSDALIIVYVLYIIGVFLKQIEVLNSRFIPIILCVIGVGIAIGFLGFSMESTIQGILCAGGAVLTNEIIKQVKK